MYPVLPCQEIKSHFACVVVAVCVLQVAPAVKALSSEQLTKFQEDGEIIVEGHTLTTEDIKVTSLW